MPRNDTSTGQTDSMMQEREAIADRDAKLRILNETPQKITPSRSTAEKFEYALSFTMAGDPDPIDNPAYAKAKEDYEKAQARVDAFAYGNHMDQMNAVFVADKAKALLGDTDGDGKLSRREALARFDKNKDGKITKQELGSSADSVTENPFLVNGRGGQSIAGMKIEDQKSLDIVAFKEKTKNWGDKEWKDWEAFVKAAKANEISMDRSGQQTQQWSNFTANVNTVSQLKALGYKGTDDELMAAAGSLDSSGKAAVNKAYKEKKAATASQIQADREELNLLHQQGSPASSKPRTTPALTAGQLQAQVDREEISALRRKPKPAVVSPSANRSQGGMPGSPGQGTLTAGQLQAQVDREEISALRRKPKPVTKPRVPVYGGSTSPGKPGNDTPWPPAPTPKLSTEPIRTGTRLKSGIM